MFDRERRHSSPGVAEINDLKRGDSRYGNYVAQRTGDGAALAMPPAPGLRRRVRGD
ncbi:hypothetical protein KCP73_03085 [Salmonella enterica subsp. enterica]|nr:hypothetical protein KCP73_03085 [Salmonella enterica subsp. enterica]